MSIDKVKHSNHGCQLELVFSNESYDCGGCKERLKGLRYQCEKSQEKSCDFAFAVCECCAYPRGSMTSKFSGKLICLEWEKDAPLDPETTECIACSRSVRGSHYVSEEQKKHSSKKHVLHPNCAVAPPEMEVCRIKFRLVEVASAKSECIVCSESDKSYLYEFEKDRCRGHVHLVCIKRSIEKVDWRHPGHGIQVSGSEKYWKLAELILGVFIGVLSGNIIGPICSLLSEAAFQLFRRS